MESYTHISLQFERNTDTFIKYMLHIFIDYVIFNDIVTI